LLNLNSDEIRKVQIEDSQGHKLILEKSSDNSWQILEPGPQPADAETVSSNLSQFVFTQILNALEAPPAQEQIGLVSPAYILQIDTNDGRRQKVYIGAETPTQSGYYVRFNDQIYVIGKFAVDGLVQMLENPPIAPTPTSTVATPASGQIDGTPMPAPAKTPTATNIVPSPSLTATFSAAASATAAP
jgi:hypothetical protein